MKKSELLSPISLDVEFEIKYNRSYTAKLIQSSDEAKGYYNDLKNYILSYKGVSNRTSWHFESFNNARNQLIKFNIKGVTLCVYLALDASEFLDSKYKVETATSKKYEEVPCLYRIKNPRRCKYVKELIDMVMEKNGLTKGEEKHVKYNLPYEPREALLERCLIKELKAK